MPASCAFAKYEYSQLYIKFLCSGKTRRHDYINYFNATVPVLNLSSITLTFLHIFISFVIILRQLLPYYCLIKILHENIFSSCYTSVTKTYPFSTSKGELWRGQLKWTTISYDVIARE